MDCDRDHVADLFVVDLDDCSPSPCDESDLQQVTSSTGWDIDTDPAWSSDSIFLTWNRYEGVVCVENMWEWDPHESGIATLGELTPWNVYFGFRFFSTWYTYNLTDYSSTDTRTATAPIFSDDTDSDRAIIYLKSRNSTWGNQGQGSSCYGVWQYTYCYCRNQEIYSIPLPFVSSTHVPLVDESIWDATTDSNWDCGTHPWWIDDTHRIWTNGMSW